MKINFAKFGGALILCQLAGVIGSFFTVGSIDGWYETLVKPSLNPPNWVFGPVWTTLYILMGIALYRIWTFKKTNAKKFVLKFFYAQLVLNALWSIFFFGMESVILAWVDICFLWGAIFVTIVESYKIDKTTGLILTPYILWVSFAAYLNFALLILNR